MKMKNTEQQIVVSKKKVSFSNRVKVKKGKSLKTYTREQKQDSWYTRQDFDKMQREMKATLVIMKTFENEELAQEQDNSVSFCFRGLEWKTQSGALLRLQIQKISTAAVLFEQRRQREQGNKEVSPAQIARTYSKFSDSAAKVARKRGLQDEKATIPDRMSGSTSDSSSSPFTLPPNGQRTTPKNKTRLIRRLNGPGTSLPSSIRVAHQEILRQIRTL